mmetsp:Transcript_5941/g.17811  ORF Transcript_5941/g.17811 Transcript_5941/m.17811 type:complete len:426 (-) Transcript_5941:463-1740(-)
MNDELFDFLSDREKWRPRGCRQEHARRIFDHDDDNVRLVTSIQQARSTHTNNAIDVNQTAKREFVDKSTCTPHTATHPPRRRIRRNQTLAHDGLQDFCQHALAVLVGRRHAQNVLGHDGIRNDQERLRTEAEIEDGTVILEVLGQQQEQRTARQRLQVAAQHPLDEAEERAFVFLNHGRRHRCQSDRRPESQRGCHVGKGQERDVDEVDRARTIAVIAVGRRGHPLLVDEELEEGRLPHPRAVLSQPQPGKVAPHLFDLPVEALLARGVLVPHVDEVGFVGGRVQQLDLVAPVGDAAALDHQPVGVGWRQRNGGLPVGDLALQVRRNEKPGLRLKLPRRSWGKRICRDGEQQHGRTGDSGGHPCNLCCQRSVSASAIRSVTRNSAAQSVGAVGWDDCCCPDATLSLSLVHKCGRSNANDCSTATR